MVIDYIKFKKLTLSENIILFFIHGNPRNISNELEHDIRCFHKKLDYKSVTYVMDDDSQTEIIGQAASIKKRKEEKKGAGLYTKTLQN